MRVRYALCICAFLLVATSAHAGDIEDSTLVYELKTKILGEGRVYVRGGSMSQLEINLTIPQNTPYQISSYLGEKVEDAYGNKYAHIAEMRPNNPYLFSVMNEVITRERMTFYLPKMYSKEGKEPYLAPCGRIQSNDALIMETARGITENATDDFEKVALISRWVKRNVKYDLSMVGENKDALWVLKNRRGVCIEYATLFAALARSVGIPVRIIAGYAPDYGEWVGHAWAEAYVGDWIPVDPLWMEVGNLDATHIELSKSPCAGASSSAMAFITSGGSLEFEYTGDSKPTIAVSEVKVREKQNVEPRLTRSEIGLGESAVVFFELKPSDYRVETFTIDYWGGFLTPVSEKEKFIVFRPNETKYVAWVVRSNASLARYYIYTSGIVVNSDSGEYGGDTNISINPNAREGLKFSAWLEDSQVAIGKNQTIYYRVESVPKITVSDPRIGFIYETAAGSVPIHSKGFGKFVFSPTKLGRNSVIVYSNDGGALELFFDVVRNATIRVGEVEVVERALVGSLINISISVENDGYSADNMWAIVEFGGLNISQSAAVCGNYTFLFFIPAERAGVENISIVIKSDRGFEKRIFRDITIERKPNVSISPKYNFLNTTHTAVFLGVVSEGKAENITITINGRMVEPVANAVDLVLPAGSYEVIIRWNDDFGNVYSRREIVDVPVRTGARIKINPREEEGEAGSCASAFVIFPALIIVLASRRES
ncbi:MAG: transglutaminase-like domain-containing protein [Candidatus Micrarchaeia archaeon]